MFPERAICNTKQTQHTNILQNKIACSEVIRDLRAKFLYNRLTRRNSFKNHRPTFLRISDVWICDPAPLLSALRKKLDSWENTIGRSLSRDHCRNPGNNLANLLASRYSPEYVAATLKLLHYANIGTSSNLFVVTNICYNNFVIVKTPLLQFHCLFERNA